MHGSTSFCTEPIETSGNLGTDVFYEDHNDFLFRYDEADQYIKLEVWEDNLGFLSEAKVDIQKFLLNPDQGFSELVTMKDEGGWSCGTLRFEVIYYSKAEKFELKVKSVVGMSTDGDKYERGPGCFVIGFTGLLLLGYIGVSCAYYKYSANALHKDIEEASMVDAVYFTIATITTVGYGDLKPETAGGKWFTIFFSGVGLLVTALFVGAVASYRHAAALKAEYQAEKDLAKKMREIDDGVAGEEENPWLHEGLHLFQEYSLVIIRLVWDAFALVLVVSIGTVFYYLENESDVVDAIYFAVQSTLLVGYGDLYPTTEKGKIFCMAYLPVCAIVLANFLMDVSSVPVKVRRMQTEKKVLNSFGQQLGADEFAQLTNSGKNPAYVTRQEFIFNMLLRLKKVSQHDVDRCARLFDMLDADRNGVLTAADIKHGTPAQALERARKGQGVGGGASHAKKRSVTPIGGGLPANVLDAIEKGEDSSKNKVARKASRKSQKAGKSPAT
eukprot:g80.t1